MILDCQLEDKKTMPKFFVEDSSSSCPHCGASNTPSTTTHFEKEKKDEGEKKRKRDNGWYLSIIVGNHIDLRMSSTDRFLFKKDYENFKLRVTLLIFLTLLYTLLFPSRASDALSSFLMVWYYCTLTIRESILMLNRSNIHWWWVAHHYLATALAGVVVTWPEDEAYLAFRQQFCIFSMYICVVQQLQYQYQSGCLRRLHSLGSLGEECDVTLEGFASWMFHGLTFLLPFLAIAYFFELYNAWTLLKMWNEMNECTWQVIVLSILFSLVGVGNLIMVIGIVWQKILETPAMRKASLRSKYPSMLSISSLLRRSDSDKDK